MYFAGVILVLKLAFFGGVRVLRGLHDGDKKYCFAYYKNWAVLRDEHEQHWMTMKSRRNKNDEGSAPTESKLRFLQKRHVVASF